MLGVNLLVALFYYNGISNPSSIIIEKYLKQYIIKLIGLRIISIYWMVVRANKR